MHGIAFREACPVFFFLFSLSAQAAYESEYNGGLGSNGLTSARHDVLGSYLSQKVIIRLRRDVM